MGAGGLLSFFVPQKKHILEDPKKEFATLGNLDSEDFFLGENYRCMLCFDLAKGEGVLCFFQERLP